MKITKAELIELKACKQGLKRFITQTNNTDEPVDVSSLVGGENTYTDLLWLASKKFPKESIVRFACDCALLNIELIKPYTDEYDLIVEFLRNPTTGVDRAVRAAYAARAARAADAARAAYAADAARAAAAHAAYAGDAGRWPLCRAAAAGYAVDAAASHVATRAADAAGNNDEVNKLLKEMFA